MRGHRPRTPQAMRRGFCVGVYTQRKGKRRSQAAQQTHFDLWPDVPASPSTRRGAPAAKRHATRREYPTHTRLPAPRARTEHCPKPPRRPTSYVRWISTGIGCDLRIRNSAQQPPTFARHTSHVGERRRGVAGRLHMAGNSQTLAAFLAPAMAGCTHFSAGLRKQIFGRVERVRAATICQ